MHHHTKTYYIYYIFRSQYILRSSLTYSLPTTFTAASQLHTLQEQAAHYCKAAVLFCQELNFNSLAAALGTMATRLGCHGVRDDILPLVRMGPDMPGPRAKVFLRAGLSTPQAIVDAGACRVLEVLEAAMPYQTAGHGQGHGQGQGQGSAGLTSVLAQRGPGRGPGLGPGPGPGRGSGGVSVLAQRGSGPGPGPGQGQGPGRGPGLGGVPVAVGMTRGGPLDKGPTGGSAVVTTTAATAAAAAAAAAAVAAAAAASSKALDAANASRKAAMTYLALKIVRRAVEFLQEELEFHAEVSSSRYMSRV